MFRGRLYYHLRIAIRDVPIAASSLPRLLVTLITAPDYLTSNGHCCHQAIPFVASP
jgi:hypothetical protein